MISPEGNISLAEFEDRKPLANPNQRIQNRPDVEQLVQAYGMTAQALHNPKKPELVIDSERAEHRIVLLLKLKGMSNREIAQATNYSEAWVSQIIRQPWFQERLTNELARAGEDIVENLVKLEAKTSLATLVDLRDNPNTPASVRANICIDILNRNLGKPVQRTENTTVASVVHLSGKLEDIDKQLKEVEEEEARLLGKGPVIDLTDRGSP